MRSVYTRCHIEKKNPSVTHTIMFPHREMYKDNTAYLSLICDYSI